MASWVLIKMAGPGPLFGHFLMKKLFKIFQRQGGVDKLSKQVRENPKYYCACFVIGLYSCSLSVTETNFEYT